MTTKVTVDAHAGWPVLVKSINPDTEDQIQGDVTVPPNETKDFYVHSGLALMIYEMPRGAALASEEIIYDRDGPR